MFKTTLSLAKLILFRKEYIIIYLFIILNHFLIINDIVPPLIRYTMFGTLLISPLIIGVDLNSNKLIFCTYIDLTGILPLNRLTFILSKYLINNICLFLNLFFTLLIQVFLLNLNYSVQSVLIAVIVSIIFSNFYIFWGSLIKTKYFTSIILYAAYFYFCFIFSIIIGFYVNDHLLPNYILLTLLIISIFLNFVFIKIHLKLSKTYNYKKL